MDPHVWEQNELYYDYFDEMSNTLIFLDCNYNYNPKVFFIIFYRLFSVVIMSQYLNT